MAQPVSRVKANQSPYRHRFKFSQQKNNLLKMGVVLIWILLIRIVRHSLGNPSLVAQIVRVPLPLAIGRGKIKIAKIPFSQDISKLMSAEDFEFSEYYFNVSFYCFE